ncbi:MAG: DUF4957 domain-containing protein [Bacteroides caccae]
MKSIKISSAISLLILLSVSFTSCEHEHIFTLENINLEKKVSDGVEIIVEPDDGITSVNSLTKAVEENGDGTYVLRRDGIYYMEGQNVFKNNIIVKAENGTGNLPQIQPICDEQGKTPTYIMELEGNAFFENIFFLGKDAATGNLISRAFRLQAAGLTLELNHCFLESSTSCVVRCDDANNKISFKNCTLRNVSNATSPSNGRLIDTRGHEQERIVFHNNYIYNVTGHILRLDNSCTKYFELSNNTFWNQAHCLVLDYLQELVIENNIFANYGWKSSESTMWDVLLQSRDERSKIAKITIRNNNFFDSSELTNLYEKYPENKKTTWMSEDAIQMEKEGRFIYENNFTEVLSFDYAPKLPIAYMEYFFIHKNEGISKCTDPFDIDEDGKDGIINGETFTFNYSPSSKSATASTTGGPIGAHF